MSYSVKYTYTPIIELCTQGMLDCQISHNNYHKLAIALASGALNEEEKQLVNRLFYLIRRHSIRLVNEPAVSVLDVVNESAGQVSGVA